MDTFQAIILGLVQGLTEFLPVSSSGHLAIGKELFGIQSENLAFEVAVHAATVVSTIVAFRKEIFDLLRGFFQFKYNEQTKYVLAIIISMIPVGIAGFTCKDFVEEIFGSGIRTIGFFLLLTAALLVLGEWLSNRSVKNGSGREITYSNALIIGIAQAFAVLPGLSRSGTTIATGLMCGVKKSAVAQFSFLMVLVPILGEAFLDLIGGEFSSEVSGISTTALSCGSAAAFVSGYCACRWMISIVRKAHLWWFAVYCAAVGTASIILG